MVRNLLLSASPILVTWGAAQVKKMTFSRKKIHIHDWYELTSRYLCVARLYTLCTSFNILQMYITGDHMLKLSHIFWGLISSMFVSYLYGLIWNILYQICFGPYCIMTTPLVQHCVIKNGSLYGVSYFMQRDY